MFFLALLRDGSGYGGLFVVGFTAALLLLGLAPIVLWERRRASRR
ncbi:MAG TPA: hypothetical protein VGM22_12455 [Methylomirabilota bacterium]|jgi:membrane protein YqaA with SNARE-associated domain